MILSDIYRKFFKKFCKKLFSIDSVNYLGFRSKRITLLGYTFIIKPKLKPVHIEFPQDCKSITDINFRTETPPAIKNLAIFASFNKKGIISDYVVYYLKELKKYVDGIIFVADNPVLESELEKIKDLVLIAQCKRHGGYDFMSYKLGFQLAQQYDLLKYADNLIICNDSCYGPLKSFENIFIAASDCNCDFWGLSADSAINTHIQSFFYIFKKNVFNSKYFINYINNIKNQPSVIQVIEKYECGFTKYLTKHKFTYNTLVPISTENIKSFENKTCYPLTMLKDFNYQLVKVKVFKGGLDLKENPQDVLEYIKQNNPTLYNIIIEDTKLTTTDCIHYISKKN